MAKVFIEEFMKIANDPASGTALPMVDRFVTSHNVDIDGASKVSAAFQPETRFIAVLPTANCRFSVGFGNPDATASNRYLPTGQTRYLRVSGGEKIAVIADV